MELIKFSKCLSDKLLRTNTFPIGDISKCNRSMTDYTVCIVLNQLNSSYFSSFARLLNVKLDTGVVITKKRTEALSTSTECFCNSVGPSHASTIRRKIYKQTPICQNGNHISDWMILQNFSRDSTTNSDKICAHR